MKPLSQKLAELSVQAKSAEDRAAKARSEARERIEQQREQIRQETEQALGKIKQHVDSATGEARTRLNLLQAKVDADFAQMKQDAAEKKAKLEAWQAENYATDKEADAEAAIEYAIAATKMAEFQTLTAIAARARADFKSEQVQEAPTLA
jgi:hypothetical protein